MTTGGFRRYLISATTAPFGSQLETGHFVWRFYIEGLGAGRNGTIDIAVDEVVRFGFFKNAGAGENDQSAVSRMNDAVARFGLQRAKEMLEREAEFEGIHTIRVQPQDMADVVRLYLSKTCTYQVLNGRDLFCSVASPGDETAVATDGIRRLAPTTRAVCLACNLPATDFICSHLSHPQIGGLRSEGRVERAMMLPPLCDLGLPGVIDNATLCRAGGHSCWRAVVEPQDVEPAVPHSPVALAEAFDDLDAIWRLAFGKEKRLLFVKRAGDVVGLTQPCATPDEFDSRMSDLTQMVKSLHVLDELLPEALRGTPKEESLNRLAAVMEARLPPEERGRVVHAIAILRAVTGIRVAAQHSDAAVKQPAGLHTLGIAFPIRNYGEAWDRIRSQTVGAFYEIREAIRTLT